MVTGKGTYAVMATLLILLSCSAAPESRTEAPVDQVIRSFNGEPVIPRQANTIYLEPFINRTGQADIRERLHTALHKLITEEGRLAVSGEKERADLLLRGSIIQYRAVPLSFTDFGRPLELRISMIVTMEMVDLKKNTVILQDSRVQAFRNFSEVRPPMETEFQAREKLVEVLARRILSMTASGWYTDQMTPVEKGKK